MAGGTPLPLLFINKDRQSRSLSNSKDDTSAESQVQRHVQHYLRGRYPRRRQKAIQSSTRNIVGWRAVPASPNPSPSLTDADSVHEVESVTEIRNKNLAVSPLRSPVLRKERMGELRSPIPRALDSLNSPWGFLDAEKCRTLQYCLNTWMPSQEITGPSTRNTSQIFGFSAVARLDRRLAHMVVSSALLTSDELHMNALLSVAGNRMQFVSKIQPPSTDRTALYTVRAIQGVRKWVAEGLPASDRLLQDIGYLVLGETYARNPNTLHVYWELIRKLIVDCGGLQQLTPYTSWVLLGADHLRHQMMVQPPALDFRKYPELLAIRRTEATSDGQLDVMITEAMAQTGPRVQAYSKVIMNFSEAMTYICCLPPSAIEKVRRYIREQIQFPSRPYFSPLQQMRPVQDEPDEQYQQEFNADIAYFHAKYTSCTVWLWYVTLSFLEGGKESGICEGATTTISKLKSEIEGCILSAEAMLLNSPWKMPDASLLWILGLLVLVTGPFLPESVETTTRFVRVANRMDIVREQHLREILIEYLPLDLVRANAYELLFRVLWTANTMRMKNDAMWTSSYEDG